MTEDEAQKKHAIIVASILGLHDHIYLVSLGPAVPIPDSGVAGNCETVQIR